jgi:SAM-dependent methyltransferase
MSAFKSGVQRLLGLTGYQLRRLKQPYADFLADPPTPDDQAWSWYHVSQMANRTYQPSVLAYRRGKRGDDERLKYLMYFLDVREQRVLELGPLEGHHSILLEKLGVRENVALEGRRGNFETCRRIQAQYGLERTDFVHGDIERIVSGADPAPFSGCFDLIFCCGVLYHLTEPLPFLRWCRERTHQLFIATRIVYPVNLATDVYTNGDLSYPCIRRNEIGRDQRPLGISETGILLTERGVVRMLADAGFGRVHVLGHDVQYGSPHVTLLAEA